MRTLLRLGRRLHTVVESKALYGCKQPAQHWIVSRSSNSFLRSSRFQEPGFTQAAACFATEANAKNGDIGASPSASSESEDSEKPVKAGKPDAEKKADGEPKAEKKADADAKGADKKPETQEQKLLKEVKKLEQLLREKDSLLDEKNDMIKELKDNVLRSYAELENFRERASREAESTRKFSIQGFSKSMLDVADNLERALSSVPEDYASKNPEELKKLFTTMLEGVKMTEKQLFQVYKKNGVERFDPAGQAFDPNVHLAICEVTDPSKSAGTVANVFKVGYMLHERVLRPAEVSVVKAAEEEKAS